MEKKNILLGNLLLLLFMILGVYLEMKLGSGSEWKESARKALWKTAHLHGALFGILNILYGLLIRNFKLFGKIIWMGSIFAFLGGLLFPGALFLGGIYFKAIFIAPLGGLCMICGWIIMFYKLLQE